jgi:hypothetical protein
MLRLKPVAEAIARFNKSRRVAGLSSDLERAGVNSTTRDALTREAEELARSTRQVPVQQQEQQQLTGPTKPPTDPPASKPAAPAAQPAPAPVTPKDLVKKVQDEGGIVKTGGRYDRSLTPGEQRALDHDLTDEARAEEERIAKQMQDADTKRREFRAKQKAQREAQERSLSPEERDRLAQQRKEAEEKRADRLKRKNKRDLENQRQRNAKRDARAKQRAEEARQRGEAPPAADEFEDIPTAELDPDDL